MRNLFPSMSQDEFNLVIIALQNQEASYEQYLDQILFEEDRKAVEVLLAEVRDLLGHLCEENFRP